MKYIIQLDSSYIAWFKNNKWHRKYGPALEYSEGSKYWWINHNYHRLDGPAIEYVDGRKWWCINNISFTEEEFNKVIQSGKI